MKTLDYAPPELGPSGGTPWVETREGGLFFVNALLAAPMLMTLYPVTLRWLLRVTGVLDRPSRVLDPVPAVAAHFLPVVGWFAVPALVFAARTFLRTAPDRRWARRALALFAVVHLGTVAWTVAYWF